MPDARHTHAAGQIDRVLADESKLRRRIARALRPSDFHGVFTSQHAKAGHGSRHRAASASVALYLLSDSVEYRAFTNVSNHAAVIFPSWLSWQAARSSLTSEVERARLMKHTLSHKFHALCSLGAAKTRKGPTSLLPFSRQRSSIVISST